MFHAEAEAVGRISLAALRRRPSAGVLDPMKHVARSLRQSRLHDRWRKLAEVSFPRGVLVAQEDWLLFAAMSWLQLERWVWEEPRKAAVILGAGCSALLAVRRALQALSMTGPRSHVGDTKTEGP